MREVLRRRVLIKVKPPRPRLKPAPHQAGLLPRELTREVLRVVLREGLTGPRTGEEQVQMANFLWIKMMKNTEDWKIYLACK